MEASPVIGVLGGMGPYAGLDLVHKIFDHTVAGSDQEHLPVLLWSQPSAILDRTAYLLGQVDENPGIPMARFARRLIADGATALGIPCNSAHAPPIFERFLDELGEAARSGVQILHMIDEAVDYIRREHKDVGRVGVLSTLSTYQLALYPKALAKAGLESVLPDENVQEQIVHRAIYDPSYGIKAKTNPVSKIAQQSVRTSIAHLRQKGAEAIILGCSELPLAMPEASHDGLPLIDPTAALARGLIRATYPDKLRTL